MERYPTMVCPICHEEGLQYGRRVYHSFFRGVFGITPVGEGCELPKLSLLERIRRFLGVR